MVRQELTKLRDPETKASVHENRQNQLQRFCEARLRNPHRLAKLSLGQERVRWENTLKGFDRLLWESMRSELLEKRVAKAEEFVELIEDLVVCHCDQIPMWLRLGAAKGLYKGSEVQSRKRKLYELKKRGEQVVGGDEEGA